MKLIAALALTAFFAAGCDSGAPEQVRSDGGETISHPAAVRTVTGRPPEIAAGPMVADHAILAGLTQAELQMLPAVEGCTLQRENSPVISLVSGNGIGKAAGDGIARIDGTFVHLTGVPKEVSDIAYADRYSAKGAQIEVRLDPELGPAISVGEGASGRPVRVTATSGDRNETFTGMLICAS